MYARRTRIYKLVEITILNGIQSIWTEFATEEVGMSKNHREDEQNQQIMEKMP